MYRLGIPSSSFIIYFDLNLLPLWFDDSFLGMGALSSSSLGGSV